MLEHIAGRPGLEGAGGVGDIEVHGEKDDGDLLVFLLQLPNRLDPVQQRHRHIRHHDVRHQPVRRLEQGPAVFDDPHQLIVLFKQAAQPLGHHAMVVSKQ